MRPRLVLMVDDSPEDTELMLRALVDYTEKNEFVTLRDGVEALDYLYRRGNFADHEGRFPDLILLDLKMPKVDGLEVLKQIKSDPELRSIPVVVMTSSREEPDVINCYRNGANGFVVKPLGYRELLETAEQIAAFWIVRNELPVRKSA